MMDRDAAMHQLSIRVLELQCQLAAGMLVHPAPDCMPQTPAAALHSAPSEYTYRDIHRAWADCCTNVVTAATPEAPQPEADGALPQQQHSTTAKTGAEEHKPPTAAEVAAARAQAEHTLQAAQAELAHLQVNANSLVTVF